jgi:DNA-binding transcriptional LysR family regulator
MVMGQPLADLAKGEADIAIRGGGSGGSEALVGIKIADTPWGVYASSGFVERFGRPRDVEDLAPFSIVELVHELERVPAVSWMQAHTQGAPIAARCGNVPTAVLAVKAGAGLAVLPAPHVAGDEELVCVLGPLQVPVYSLYLFVHKDLRRVPRVSAFSSSAAAS